MVKRMLILLLCALLPCAALAQGMTDDYSLSDALDTLGTELTSPAATAAPADLAVAVQVIDDARVLSTAEEELITEVIERIEEHHQVDIVVLVTYDVPKDYSDSLWKVRDFADDFYDNGGYGMGPDFSGLLYLIDLNNRVQYISTGGVMIEYISDAREEEIFDAAERYLLRGDWGRAALMAIRHVETLMSQGRERGAFLYDAETGRRLSGYHNPLEPFEMFLAACGGVLAALLLTGSVSASYNLKRSTYRYEMTDNVTYDLTRDDEQFIRQHVSRRARSTGSSGGYGGRSGGRSGGSGVHRSSSGRSHGGGGRRF